jgi:hypothetical protein
MISCGWTISHRCGWITVYVLCCNAQVNLIVIFMICTCIDMHSLFCQLPNCNFVYPACYLSLWRDNSSELWTSVHSFIYITFYCKHRLLSASIIYLLTANKYPFPHDTFNPLFSANQWDWQPHCKLGKSILIVLCEGSTFLLAPKLRPRHFLGSVNKLVPLPKSASNNLRKWFLSPTGRLNFGYITEGKLTVVLITPYSWGSQLIYAPMACPKQGVFPFIWWRKMKPAKNQQDYPRPHAPCWHHLLARHIRFSI